MSQSTAVDVIHDPQPPAPVATGDSGMLALGRTPQEAIDNAQGIAKVLMKVIRDQSMTTVIPSKKGGKREHVNVEAWTTLGALTGHSVTIEWTRICEDDEGHRGWEARAILITGTGQAVAAAEAMCTRGEKDWKHRASYALRSMAQTRAVSKAFRTRLDFIVKLAGFQTTPDEEIPRSEVGEDQWREWTKAAMEPLIEMYGREVAEAAWKDAGRPYFKATDEDIARGIIERAEAMKADQPVEGTVVDAQEPQEGDEPADGGDTPAEPAEAATGGDSAADADPAGYPPPPDGWTSGVEGWTRWCWLLEQHGQDPHNPDKKETDKLVGWIQDSGAAPNIEMLAKDSIWKRVLAAIGSEVREAWEARQGQQRIDTADATGMTPEDIQAGEAR